jgi:hypothetical protein
MAAIYADKLLILGLRNLVIYVPFVIIKITKSHYQKSKKLNYSANGQIQLLPKIEKPQK